MDAKDRPLMPCTEKRARLLLERGRAKVVNILPFTIRLLDRLVEDSILQPSTLKFDPGSETTGAALVREIGPGTPDAGAVVAVIMLSELSHRGPQIKKGLERRRNCRRRRRSKNLRYRKPRFFNRGNKGPGWLAPSIRHRVDQAINFAAGIIRPAPATSLAMELVKFDTRALQNPEINGVEYRQGALAGYELREHLLEKWGRKCAYRGAENVPLQVEHVVPRAKGGSDRVSNLTLACRPRNAGKGSLDLREFLAKRPETAEGILARAKAPLRDAAAVNSSRRALFDRLKGFGLPLIAGTGGRTKYNRALFGVPKAHALDAARVGPLSGIEDWRAPVLEIVSRGRGSYRRTRVTADGFPRGYLTRSKTVHGFQTGDLVRAVVPNGKYAGVHTGRVAVRASGRFAVQAGTGKIEVGHGHCRLLQRNDGYEYRLRKADIGPNSSLG